MKSLRDPSQEREGEKDEKRRREGRDPC